MQMNRVVIAGYVSKTAGSAASPFRHSRGQCPGGRERPIRGWQRGNTGTHELAQPQFLRKACRCRPGAQEGRQHIRRWPDRAAAVHRARRQQAADGARDRSEPVSRDRARPTREQIGGHRPPEKMLPMDQRVRAPGLKMTGQLRANWTRADPVARGLGDQPARAGVRRRNTRSGARGGVGWVAVERLTIHADRPLRQDLLRVQRELGRILPGRARSPGCRLSADTEAVETARMAPSHWPNR